MKLILFVMLLLGQSVYALEDYSYQEDVLIPSPSKLVAPRSKSSSSNYKKAKKKQGIFVSLLYDSVNVEDALGNLNTLLLKVSFQTKHKLTFDVSYWRVTDTAFIENPGPSPDHDGNLQFGVLFNWFSFAGNTFDLYASYSLEEKGSLVAHSYDTTTAGAYTNKRFSKLFNMGLGYELIRTSSPKEAEESNLGDGSRIYVNFNWRIRPDIRFALEVGNYKFDPPSRDIKFGYVAPQLVLTVSDHTTLNLGVALATRNNHEDELKSYKLWDYKGIYGNSVFTSLTFSL